MYDVNITKEDVLTNKYIISEFKGKIPKEIFIKLCIVNLVLALIDFILLLIIKYSLNGFNISIRELSIYFSDMLFSKIIVLNCVFLILIFIIFKSRENKNILNKYRYLIGEFKISINENILNLNSKYRNIKLDLDNSKVSIGENSLILKDDKNFKIIIPLNKLDDKDFISKLKVYIKED